MAPNSDECERFQTAFLPAVYGVEFCVALVGNLVGLWFLVTRQKRNWHTGVVLTCNLAVSDLLYVLTLPLLIAYYTREKDWPFGAVLCKLERFLFTCNLYVSIFLIMCIGVNRYVAIVHPFFSRTYVRPAHAKAVCLAIWILVTAISSPVLTFADTCPNGSHKLRCVSYCDHTGNHTAMARSHLTYKLFLTAFGCFLPFLVTFASYCGVFWVVWKNANITAQEKRKVALIVVSGVLLYAVSFVPYHVLQSYYYYLNWKGVHDCQINKAYQVSKGLATLNMCVHPLLYMAVFDSLRVACCCGRSQDDDVAMREART